MSEYGQKPQADEGGTGGPKEQRTHSINTSHSLPLSGHLEKRKKKKKVAIPARLFIQPNTIQTD